MKNITAETSVRQVSESNITTIPRKISDVMGIKKGSVVFWDLNLETGKLEVSLVE